MGQCQGKNISVAEDADGAENGRRHRRKSTPTHPSNGVSSSAATPTAAQGGATPVHHSSGSFWPSPYPPGSAMGSPLPAGIAPSPARSTPRRFFRRPFPPPSPAKHIKASLVKRFGASKPKEGTIVEDAGALPAPPEAERPLDKTFGYGKHFGAKYELGKEVGRGHFGHTCTARVRKGDMKGQIVAVKIISKAKEKVISGKVEAEPNAT